MSQDNDTTIYCTKCGQQNPANNHACSACEALLHDTAPTPTTPQIDNTMGGLIPYKNAQALWAYYLGIFSLIPCIGIPLGIAAFVLGLRGLKYADAHNEAKGRAHAWVGIIMGGLCALGYTLLILIPVVMSTLG